MRKNISITNEHIYNVLAHSSNASKLVEEALIYYLHCINTGTLEAAEINRIYAQGLIDINTALQF